MLLPSRSEALTRVVREELDGHGVLPFARFMQLALYCPELGYYDLFANTLGRAGDFYTNVSVGPLFGELLAFQFALWLEALPKEPWHVVEAGAHDGTLARDILHALQTYHPATLPRLEYWITEPSPRRQACQRERLQEFAGRVRWLDSWQAVPGGGVRGIIFSNELLDAMPVHRLGWDARRKEWFEWGVGLDGDRFVWRRPESNTPPPGSEGTSVGSGEPPRATNGQRSTPNAQGSTSPDLDAEGWMLDVRDSWRDLVPEVPPELAEVLPDGFTTEVCPGAVQWWREAASRLGRGWLLTFDYGLAAEEFLVPNRATGTLRGYHRHRLTSDVLAHPGEQDLTAHVNFTAVTRAGEAAGLKTERLCSQTEFLTAIANATWLAHRSFGEWTPERVRQFQMLTHPEHLGRAFKVLVQCQ